MLVLILVGVVFYTWQENWSIADSLYFTIVALTTIGFGDFTPTTTTTRMFTIVYALTGIGILGIAINKIVTNQQTRVQRRQAQGAAEALETTQNAEQITTEQPASAIAPVPEIEDRLAQLEREIGLLRNSPASVDTEIRAHIVQQSSDIASISQQLQSLAVELSKQTPEHSRSNANEPNSP